MRKNESYNSSKERVKLDEQYKDLIEAFRANRASVETDFSKSRKHSKDELYTDAHFVHMRKKGFEKKNEEIDASFDDEALEGVLWYMGSNSQIFEAEEYSEPGSDYDDYRNGVDVVFGIPSQEVGKFDTIFSVDATTATLEDEVAGKFLDVDGDPNNDSPGCNQIKYYKHEGRCTRLNCKPNYIVGASPATIAEAVGKFDKCGDYVICPEPDEDFRRKILIELLFESKAYTKACGLVKKRTDWTKRALEAHTAVSTACLESLRRSFEIDEKAEDKSNQLMAAVTEAMRKYQKEDATFDAIVKEALRRDNKYRKQINGRKVNKAGKKNLKPVTNPA
ncbi:hypothetical protein IKG50_04095 [Candidatus Saccharibacteria bacterium]|nr:hypothetical protein [Candidatus Saccharibacteria bacterium]